MAIWSIINKKNLEGCDRLDSEYYQPCYLAIESTLQQVNAVFVSDIAVCKHRKFKPIFNIIFKYIEISEIDTVTGESKPVEVLGQNAPSRAQRMVKEGDVIISTVRPNRNAVSLINEEQNGFVCSTGFTVLKAKEIAPEYLFAYLKTKYSIKQLERKTTASMYPAVNEDDILKSLFFKADDESQKKIQKLIIEFTKCLQESKLLYSQAEQILLEELGLEDLDLKDDLFCTTTLKEVKDNNRMDTYFFMPKFDIGLSKLKMEYKLKSVLELSRDVTTGQYCNEYIDRKSGIPYIRGTDISNATINEDNLVYVDNPKNNGSKKVKEGDVVTTRVGTIGLVARIPRELEGCIISDNLIRIRLPKKSEISSYYLTMYLNSPFGKDLMISYSRGSVQQRLNQETLKEIPIPIVSNSLQVKIERFLVESWRKRKEAKQLLEQAKHKVEEMIEKEAGVK